jgi:hypothetical protein
MITRELSFMLSQSALAGKQDEMPALCLKKQVGSVDIADFFAMDSLPPPAASRRPRP